MHHFPHILLQGKDAFFENFDRGFRKVAGRKRFYRNGPELLVPSFKQTFYTLPDGIRRFHAYRKVLKQYCIEANVPVVATHGLRHSTSELYMAHGATRDDLRILFAHSAASVTDRYIHDRGSRLEKVAQQIRLPQVEQKWNKMG